MRISSVSKGYSFAFSFCAMIAYSSIFIHETNQSIKPILSVFLTFLICTLWFNLINLKNIRSLYKKVFQAKRILLIVNIATAVVWITTFDALNYIDAVLFQSLFMGLMPIVTYLIQCLQKTKKFESKNLVIFTSIAVLLFFIALLDKRSVDMIGNTSFTKGVILTIISSIASGIYIVSSKQLESKTRITPSQIVGVRFYFLLFYAGYICFYKNYFPAVGTVHFSNFILLAIISAILPAYFVQKSISYLGAMKTSMIIPFTPIFTYLIFLFLHQNFSSVLFSLLVVLSGILFYYVIATHRVSLIASTSEAAKQN